MYELRSSFSAVGWLYPTELRFHALSPTSFRGIIRLLCLPESGWRMVEFLSLARERGEGKAARREPRGMIFVLGKWRAE